MAAVPTCVSGAAPDVRPATKGDRSAIHAIHSEAFGQDEEANLALALIDDPTAAPSISLIGTLGGEVVGHCLATHATIEGKGGSTVAPASLIAPLGIVQHAQRRGCGAQLVMSTVNAARAGGRMFVFVFGDPTYYGRLGFRPAIPFGVHPPHPVGAYEDAFMIWLANDCEAPPSGTLRCAKALDDPHLWAV